MYGVLDAARAELSTSGDEQVSGQPGIPAGARVKGYRQSHVLVGVIGCFIRAPSPGAPTCRIPGGVSLYD